MHRTTWKSENKEGISPFFSVTIIEKIKHSRIFIKRVINSSPPTMPKIKILSAVFAKTENENKKETRWMEN